MSYVKLPKVIQDFGLGYQTVNDLANGEQALFDAWALRHVEGGAGGGGGGGLSLPPGAKYIGQHDDMLVPRAVALVQVFTVPGTPNGWTYLPIYTTTGGYLQAGAVGRIASGTFLIAVGNMHAEDTWAEVSAVGDGSTVRHCDARFVPSLGGGPWVGFYVRTYELNTVTGEFQTADFDFSLTIFSR